jgi:hypothetical protein
MKSITPNNSGEKNLVENCKKVSITEIISEMRKSFQTTILQTTIEIGNQQIKITTQKLHHGGSRFSFVCPLCNLPVRIIFQHPTEGHLVGCRKCLNLEYKCRRYKGMVENNI